MVKLQLSGQISQGKKNKAVPGRHYYKRLWNLLLFWLLERSMTSHSRRKRQVESMCFFVNNSWTTPLCCSSSEMVEKSLLWVVKKYNNTLFSNDCATSWDVLMFNWRKKFIVVCLLLAGLIIPICHMQLLEKSKTTYSNLWYPNLLFKTSSCCEYLWCG